MNDTEQTMRIRLRAWLLVAILLTAALAPVLPARAGKDEARPNILIITADNLGYGDLQCYRPESPILTPNLNQLAAEGARLTAFYTASPTCTVSRACLLTGRIPERHGLKRQLAGLAENYAEMLPRSEILIPEIARPAGYRTACFGKWNVGFAPGVYPTERGFEEFFGNVSGNIDYYTHVYNGRHDVYRGTKEAHDKGYSTDLFADAAVDFIRQNEDEPFLVYLPFNAPHFPNAKNKAPGVPVVWQAPDEAFAPYGYSPDTSDEKQRYHAVVTALDTAIGRVLATLEETGQAKNTIVVFFSDNGAFMLPGRGLEVSTNAPLRDGGVTCWEGGLRVAALARWPDHIEAGSVIDEPLWSCDWLAMAAALTKQPLPADRIIDGKNPLPVLTAGAESPHESLYFNYQKHSSLRMGNYKIVRDKPDSEWQLYDLSNDEGESRNIAAEHPDIVARLISEREKWESTFD